MNRLLLIAAFACLFAAFPPDARAAVMNSGACGAGTAPSNGLGSNGDLYHCTDTLREYGPKSAGSWGATYTVTIGQGCTTIYHIDKDCDGYGLYPLAPWVANQSTDPNPLFADDPDDNDAAVFNLSTVLSTYTTINAYLTHLGYSTATVMYLDPSNLSGSASDANNCLTVSTACLTISSSALSTATTGGGGVTVIVRGTTLASFSFGGQVFASSTATPVVMIAYPGEQVILTAGQGFNSGGAHSAWNVVLDHIHFHSTGSDNCVGNQQSVNVTVRNTEFSQCGHAWQGGAGTANTLLEDNLIYDGTSHSFYPTQGQIGSSVGTFDCTGWSWTDGGYPSDITYNLVIRRNVVLNSGGGGLEAVHINATVCGGEFSSNIVVGSGGTGFTFQSGPQNFRVVNNLIFDNPAYGLQMQQYGCDNSGLYNDPGEVGTVCPAGGSSLSSVGTGYSPTNIENNVLINNTIVQMNAYPATNPHAGTGAPANAMAFADDSAGYSGAGLVNQRWAGKNSVIENNLIENYDCDGSATVPLLYFGPQSYPDSYTFKNNGMYNLCPTNSHSSSHMAQFYSPSTINASYYAFEQGLLPERVTGSALITGGSILSFASFSAYNTGNNSGNVWGDPNFSDNQASYVSTPGKWDLTLTSNTLGTGLNSVAPVLDIRGLQRANPPSLGAIDFNGSAVTTSKFTFSWSANGSRTGLVTGANCLSKDTMFTGTVVTCQAIPSDTFSFTSFSGTGSAAGCSTSPCTFTLTANSTLTATFASGAGSKWSGQTVCSPSTIPVGGVAYCLTSISNSASANSIEDISNVGTWTSSNTAVATIYQPFGWNFVRTVVRGITAGTTTISHGTGYGIAGEPYTATVTVVSTGHRISISMAGSTGAMVVTGSDGLCVNRFAAGQTFKCLVSPGPWTGKGSTPWEGIVTSVTNTCGGTSTAGPGPGNFTVTGTMGSSDCTIGGQATADAGVSSTVTVAGNGDVFGMGQYVGTTKSPNFGGAMNYELLAVPGNGASFVSWSDTCGGNVVSIEDYGNATAGCIATATFSGGGVVILPGTSLRNAVISGHAVIH